MVVKVYGPIRAACPQRVLACLIEKGVDFELVHVDLDSGEHKQPEFLLKQPFGQVPVIEDGDFRLFYRTPNLLGTTLEERALVDQWLEVEAHNFNELVYTIVFQLVVLPKMGQRGDLGLVHNCEEQLNKVLDVYEERLYKSKYLAGDAFTLADLSHLPGIRYLMNEAGMGHLVKERKKVSAWWENVSGRPAWKKVLQLASYK